MSRTSENLDRLFDIDAPPVELDFYYDPGEVVDDSHLLREWEKNPENRKKRGRAISKGRTGCGGYKQTAETRAKMSAAVKKRWAEGKMANRKPRQRDPVTGRFLNKQGSKK